MFYAENADLVQTIVSILGLGFGSVVWAILYANSK